MRLQVLAFVVVSLAHPLTAQDITGGFAQAYSMFTLPGSQGTDPDAALVTIEAVLPSLEGDWVRGDTLSGDTGQLTTDRLSDACGRNVDRLVLVPPLGFEMQRTRIGKEPRLRLRYHFQGANIFSGPTTKANG